MKNSEILSGSARREMGDPGCRVSGNQGESLALFLGHPDFLPSKVEALDKTITHLVLTVLEIPRPALFLAGKAFAQYKRQGGKANNVLADFFIVAHAAVSGCPLLTRDARRYQRYFPSVKLITP